KHTLFPYTTLFRSASPRIIFVKTTKTHKKCWLKEISTFASFLVSVFDNFPFTIMLFRKNRYQGYRILLRILNVTELFLSWFMLNTKPLADLNAASIFLLTSLGLFFVLKFHVFIYRS